MVYASKKGYTVNKVGEVFYKTKKRSLVFDTKGYLSFTISIKIKGIRYCRRVWVHKLQAYQKYGRKMFREGFQVRHLDGDCKNNDWNNILIGSASQNQMDKPAEKRRMLAIRASYKNRRFSDEEVKSINEDRKNGMPYGQILKKYKTSKGTLSYLFNKAIYNGK